MFKKVLGFAAIAGSIAVSAGVGCTVGPLEQTGDGGGPAVDAAPTKDGSTTLPDRPPPPVASCYSEDEAITGFKFGAAKAAQGVCSTEQVDNILANCFGTGGDATKCKAATDAAPLCNECITGKVDGPFPAFVTIDDQGNGYIGIAVCAALVLNKPDCGPKLLTVASCLASACSTCETAGEEACETEAAAGACKDALAAAGTCNTDLTAGKAQTDPICSGATAVESLKKVANYLCGGTPVDAGGGG